MTEEQTFVFIVGEDDFQAQTLEVTHEDVRRALTAFHDFASLEGTPGELGWLYQALFAPLRPHVKTGTLIVAPHGPLHYLPFQALHDGQRYLVQDYAISYIPSASVLPFALDKRKAGASASSALVLGNPGVRACRRWPTQSERPRPWPLYMGRPLTAWRRRRRACSGARRAGPASATWPATGNTTPRPPLDPSLL